MKIRSILIVAVIAIAGYGVYANQQKNNLPNIMLENVEALAGAEGCINRPGHNNGHCTTDGSTYFCENAEAGNAIDCVKGY